MPVRAREKRGRELQGIRPTQGILVMLIRIRGTDRGEPSGKDPGKADSREAVCFRSAMELLVMLSELDL